MGFAAPYLALMNERAPQRQHDLREVFNALRWIARAGAPWRMLVQEAMGQSVRLVWADQGYTGEQATAQASEHGIELQVVKLPEAKKGFVLLPRRWVVERSFGWLARFRRPSRDYEMLPNVLAGLHFLIFVMLMLHKALPWLGDKFITRSKACGVGGNMLYEPVLETQRRLLYQPP